MLGSLGCSLGSFVTGMSAPTPTPTKSLVPTFTATATNTPTATATDTPIATDTPPPTPTGTPTPTASPTPPFVTYVVQAGDTLSGIASRFGTTAQAIMDANGMTNTIINVGTQLTIPSSGSSVSPPPNPPPTQTGAAPTSTPRTQSPPPPTATTPPPTATTQKFQYYYVEGSMQEDSRGCSNLAVEGMILDSTGNPVTGRVTISWKLGSLDPIYWATGNPMEKPGVFKFNILPGTTYHGTKTSTLQIVESEANPTPLSEPLTWQIRDCLVAPEFFSNIVFRHR